MNEKNDKNVFKNYAHYYYDNIYPKVEKNNDSFNNRLRVILQNLEINNWGEFSDFIEMGMNRWLKKKINNLREKTDRDIESLKNMDYKNMLSLEGKIDIELEKIADWQKQMSVMEFEQE